MGTHEHDSTQQSEPRENAAGAETGSLLAEVGADESAVGEGGDPRKWTQDTLENEASGSEGARA